MSDSVALKLYEPHKMIKNVHRQPRPLRKYVIGTTYIIMHENSLCHCFLLPYLIAGSLPLIRKEVPVTNYLLKRLTTN
jgi:hypothetical protein